MGGQRIGYIRVGRLDQRTERQLEGVEVDLSSPTRPRART